ncbi:Fanconi anemia group J protein [Cichlidogyrus casuarinus]|uniref:Fanconi anemia group J protein n=1 Tax=Cichlidogyrus casuarinus TaxID=1844966 RepID=A0ABD2PX99_9PLAT
MESTEDENIVNVLDYKVKFPYPKPYPSQRSMMARILSSAKNANHCLIESPTGTGKTLALLCSGLAWLTSEKNCPSFTCESSSADELKKPKLDPECQSINSDKENESVFEEDDTNYCYCTVVPEIKPKLVFCTRTHRQISQVIKELRRTGYDKDITHTILASRNHCCINPKVLKSANITDACIQLITTSHCPENRTDKRAKVRDYIWDLEDLVSDLANLHVCPYFYAQGLASTADLVICPYNYLLDPLNTDLNLINSQSIVIIDEAHNIEDAARSAASFEVSEEQLDQLISSFTKLTQYQFEVSACKQLTTMCQSLLAVMENAKIRLVEENAEAEQSQVWTGAEICEFLKHADLGPSTILKYRIVFRNFMSSIERAKQKQESNMSNYLKSGIGSFRVLSGLFTVISFLYRNNMERLNDYRMVLQETTALLPQTKNADLDSWLSKTLPNKVKVTVTLHFWCLDPSIVLTKLADSCRSLVLTSGTLSPLDALQAELGVTFSSRLEATHSLRNDRLLVGLISKGPRGTQLLANYASQNSFTFQDELGALVLDCATQMKECGILCFLPSYSLLSKLVERWKMIGLWQRLIKLKHVMQEPKRMGEFKNWLVEFNAAVDFSRGIENEDTSEFDFATDITGCLAFAVYRGKVSEGLDFPDHYARMVIAVGIPFPAIKNPQVQQKMAFNTAKTKQSSSTEMKPLSGDEWYEAQAFRAYNQALGRCIRHVNDWGCILMVDSRLTRPKNLQNVSKWVSSRSTNYLTWNQFICDLQNFLQCKDN